jgi:hypothetical protein
MGLPIQQAPKYKATLSDGKEVTFRPFLVKEQKYLLLAKEGKNGNEVLDAVRELISSVTFGEVDTDTLPLWDLEYLFLQVRTKSVGETIDLRYKCFKEGCNGSMETTVDLSQVQLKFSDEEIDNVVKLTDTLGVMLKYPTAREIVQADTFKDEGDKIVHLLKHGIHQIFDEENVYDTSDTPEEELQEFVETLTLEQVNKLQDFFSNIPTLSHEANLTCGTCGAETRKVLQGLQSFF